MYRELEDLFLTMEGVAGWAAYTLAERDPHLAAVEADAKAIASTAWVQGEGLVLFLLMNRMVPDWRERVFGSEPASPFLLLEEAAGQGSRR
ncbi:MAG: hypothetical protein ACREOF_14195 [Gemmatimonadales bacterium]